MERLIEGMGKNNVEEYDKIFLKRKENGIDAFDLKRWGKLLKFYKGGKLCDLGCLDSLIPQMAKEKYPKEEIWGMDIAEKTIEELKEKYPNIYYQIGDVYNTKFPQNYFSYCVAGELIEHLERPEDFIKEAFRILKSGGIFALSTPLEEAREKGACDVDRHLWSFNKYDIIQMLEPYGKVWIRRLGSQFFPHYIYHFPNILGYCRKK